MSITHAAAVIPAKDESATIGATVRSAATIPGVDLIVVVDDASSDDTGVVAHRAGAEVLTHPRNKGKAAAMMAGAMAVHNREVSALDADRSQRALLFIDADLGSTASATAPLTEPVLAGDSDMTIAVLPRQDSDGGGFGFVVGLAKRGIAELAGFDATQPLSGMRCLTREAYNAAIPFAPGWGVETAMTIDLITAGLRVREVECALQHRVTGKDFKAQLHRAAQYRDVWRALAARKHAARKHAAQKRRGKKNGVTAPGRKTHGRTHE